MDPYYKTWIEDPLPVLSTIQTYIIKGGFDFEEHAIKIIEEREKLISDTIKKIPTPEEQEEFTTLLKYAQYTYPFNEDHNFYVEQWTYSELRYAILECGCRLAGFKVLEKEEDVFFLTISELENILNDLILNPKIGAQDHVLRIPMLIKSLLLLLQLQLGLRFSQR